MKHEQTKDELKAIKALLDAGLIDALEAHEMREYLDSIVQRGEKKNAVGLTQKSSLQSKSADKKR